MTKYWKKASKTYHLPKEKSRRDPEYWQMLELPWIKWKVCQIYFSASHSGQKMTKEDWREGKEMVFKDSKKKKKFSKNWTCLTKDLFNCLTTVWNNFISHMS